MSDFELEIRFELSGHGCEATSRWDEKSLAWKRSFSRAKPGYFLRLARGGESLAGSCSWPGNCACSMGVAQEFLLGNPRGVAIRSSANGTQNFRLGSTIDAMLDKTSPQVKWQPGAHTPSDLKKIRAEQKQAEKRTPNGIACQEVTPPRSSKRTSRGRTRRA
jgi:hypothetical protein